MFTTHLLLGAAALIPATAFASDTSRIVVPVHDVDLSSAAGHSTLTKRLARAAASVCPASDARNPATQRATRSCQAEAMARTAEQITRAAQRQTREAVLRAARQPIS